MRQHSRRHAVLCAVLEALESRRLLSLAAPASYGVGDLPQAITAADLNGDGRSDVVTANINGGNVSVLLGTATGAMHAAQNFATGGYPRSVAVGDVNNDSKRDVVTANAANVSILIGNGNGTLQVASNLTLPGQFPTGYTGAEPLAQSPLSVAVGDVNADGKLDLVVGAFTTHQELYSGYWGTYYRTVYTNYVNVLLGNGNGTFATANSSAHNNWPDPVALVDLNNDNKLDLLIGTSSVAVRLGNGDGTFQTPVATSIYGQPLVGDFDGDGKKDIATVSYSHASIYKGQGNGTSFSFARNVFIGGNARSAVTGDVDADGKLDLIVSTQQTTYEYYGYYGGYNPTTTDQTKVLLGFGDGTFSLPITSTLRSYADYPTGYNAIALGDVNGDGRIDVAATEPAADNVTVQLNQGGWVPPVGVSINDISVTEGNSGTVNAVFTVTLDHAASFNVTVDYSTEGNYAVAGTDFVATSGTLSFAAGQTSKTITVPVKGDRVGEADEDFFVHLTGGPYVYVLERGDCTIKDDEPRISVTSNPTVVEGDSGTKPMTFTFGLLAPSDAPVTFKYSTNSWGSATPGQDFDVASDTVTFQPGQTSVTMTVAIRGDVIPEYDEGIYLSLSDATNGLLVSSYTYGAIDDNDPGPSVVVSNVTRAEGNSGTTAFQFTLTLLTPSERELSVFYATGGGSASTSGGNKDYDAVSGTAYFYQRQMTQTVTVLVRGDTRSESDETFFLNLSNPSDGTIADAQGVATILNDETRGKTWVGPASGGSWSTAANWSPSGAPTATSLVTISGASVTLPASATVSELSLTNGATLTVGTNGSRVLRTAALFMDETSTLNLGDNDLIVDYAGGTGGAGISPLGAWNKTPWAAAYDGLAGLIARGRGGTGEWDGTGIVTTRAQAIEGVTTLGISEASAALGISGNATALWNGQTVDATTVLVKYTYTGDGDLNGYIDAVDYGRIDNWIQFPGTSGYFNGDYNHDGVIDAVDYGYIDNNIQVQGSPL